MRLVDADLLEKDGFTVQTQEYGSVDVVSLDCIADATTVEAAPVVHGKWKTIRGNFVTGGGNSMWGCSKCGSLIGASLLPPKENYCSNCAAKMDL